MNSIIHFPIKTDLSENIVKICFFSQFSGLGSLGEVIKEESVISQNIFNLRKNENLIWFLVTWIVFSSNSVHLMFKNGLFNMSESAMFIQGK